MGVILLAMTIGGLFVAAILVGDEDSLRHERNYFKLEEHAQTASVK